MLRFHVLGPLEIEYGNNVTRPRGRLRRKVLTLLLVNAGRLVLTDVLVGEVWPQGRPARAENALQAHVSRLRRLLAVVEPEATEPRLVTHPAGYQLNVADDELDATLFTRQLKAIRPLSLQEPDAAARRLRGILTLWRGPALGGVTDGPILAEASARYRESHLAALELLYDCELRCGNHAGVVSELRDLLAPHRRGRQAGTLDVYRQLWHRLSQETGLEPAPR